MTALKLRKIGNSLGLVLPKEELAILGLQEGDTVHLTRTPGGARLTVHDPEFERQMAVGRRVAKKYVNALRELAK
jgi:putative addiction module antidote